MGLLTATAPDDAGRLYDNAKLRQWRADAGLTREQVWAEVGVSVAWLAELEQGRPSSAPSLDLLVRLARFYGHEPAELLVPA
jgi:transcriptional regulator with XRE-family HTH domain